METLAPQDFLEFRSGLGTARWSYHLISINCQWFPVVSNERNGNPSRTWWEPEIALWSQRPTESFDRVGREGSRKWVSGFNFAHCLGHYIIDRLERVKSGGSLRDALHNWLYRTPINGSMPDTEDDDKNIDNFLNDYLTNQERAAEEHIQTVVADQGKEFEPTLRQRYEGTSFL